MYGGRRYLTKYAREVKELVGLMAKSQWKQPPLEDDICLNVIFYFNRANRDIDNALKALLDSLEGVLFKNDRQITELHVYKYVDKKNPRVIVQVL